MVNDVLTKWLTKNRTMDTGEKLWLAWKYYGARALSQLASQVSWALTDHSNSIICAPLSNWFHSSPKLLSVTVNLFLSTVLLFKEDRFSVILSFDYGCKVISLYLNVIVMGISPVAEWLRLWASGSNPGWGSKILQAMRPKNKTKQTKKTPTPKVIWL